MIFWYITPIPHPAYHPNLTQNTNFGIFYSILIKIGVEVNLRQMWKKWIKILMRVFCILSLIVLLNPSTSPSIPPQPPRNADFGIFQSILIKIRRLKADLMKNEEKSWFGVFNPHE